MTCRVPAVYDTYSLYCVRGNKPVQLICSSCSRTRQSKCHLGEKLRDGTHANASYGRQGLSI